jgi:hypothetical protein
VLGRVVLVTANPREDVVMRGMKSRLLRTIAAEDRRQRRDQRREERRRRRDERRRARLR